MPLFEWNEIYGTGIGRIDEQHQRLFALVNNVHQAMKEGKGKEILDATLKELLEYVFYHFNEEEELMQKYSFSDFHIHRTEHDNLTKNLLELRGKFKDGNTFITSELISFLKSWLTIHILQSDMKFSKYMKTIQVQQNQMGVNKNAG